MLLIACMYYHGKGVIKDNINVYMWVELGIIYVDDDEEYVKVFKFCNEIVSNMMMEDIIEGCCCTENW